jgi:hypothetical protein
VRQKSPTAFIKNRRIFFTTTTREKRGRAEEKKLQPTKQIQQTYGR